MANELTTPNVALPAVNGFTAPMLQALTDALGINRDVLATDAQIENAWQNLPQLLNSIPPEKRDEGIMRMCVCLLYTSPSPRDKRQSRMPSSA